MKIVIYYGYNFNNYFHIFYNYNAATRLCFSLCSGFTQLKPCLKDL